MIHSSPLATHSVPRNQRKTPALKLVVNHTHPESTLSALQFSGTQHKSFWKKLMLLAAGLVPLGIGATANAQSTPQPLVSTSLAASAHSADIDEAKTPFVDSKLDVPQLNGTMRQAVVDLARNPLLSPQTRQDIEKLLTEFNKSNHGQMAVVVIPDTHRREINTLATEIFNQIGIGNAGKNDGTILLLNKAAMKEGRRTGRMQITTGTGIERTLSGEMAVQILKQNALPSLQAGNYDQAVQKTVQAVTSLLENGQVNTAKANALFNTAQPQNNTQWTDQEIAVAILIAIVVVLLVVGLAVALSNSDGYSGGGWSSGGGSWSSSSSGDWGGGWSSSSSSSGGGWSSGGGGDWGGGGSSWGGGMSGGSGGGI